MRLSFASFYCNAEVLLIQGVMATQLVFANRAAGRGVEVGDGVGGGWGVRHSHLISHCFHKMFLPTTRIASSRLFVRDGDGGCDGFCCCGSGGGVGWRGRDLHRSSTIRAEGKRPPYLYCHPPRCFHTSRRGSFITPVKNSMQ